MSSDNIEQQHSDATKHSNRAKEPVYQIGPLRAAVTAPEAWAKESFEIATKIAYQNGALRGTQKGQRKDCREVTDPAVLPVGYTTIASKIADRRMTLSVYRLADLLRQNKLN